MNIDMLSSNDFVAVYRREVIRDNVLSPTNHLIIPTSNKIAVRLSTFSSIGLNEEDRGIRGGTVFSVYADFIASLQNGHIRKDRRDNTFELIMKYDIMDKAFRLDCLQDSLDGNLWQGSLLSGLADQVFNH